jgi:hypothetical protein
MPHRRYVEIEGVQYNEIHRNRSMSRSQQSEVLMPEFHSIDRTIEGQTERPSSCYKTLQRRNE